MVLDEPIFEMKNFNTGWDGTLNGQEAQSGMYAFNLFLKQHDGSIINITGTISLVK